MHYVRLFVPLCWCACVRANIHTFLCVCARLCLYVRIYVCISVCLYVCIFVFLYVFMHVLMYACMYACIYVYTCEPHVYRYGYLNTNTHRQTCILNMPPTARAWWICTVGILQEPSTSGKPGLETTVIAAAFSALFTLQPISHLVAA